MDAKGLPVTPELRQYLLEHSLPRTDVHRRLVELTAEQLGDTAVMQIAEEQGPVLTFLTRLIGARVAVEIGTFTGLSALCIAEGLPVDGRLTCFDIAPEWTDMGRPFWEDAGVADRIDVVIGPAAERLAARTFDPLIDLAFIDADKTGYPIYLDLVLERMRPGGLVLVDNTLYFGTVLDPEPTDESVLAIQRFNDAVALDDRVDAVLLNVGDGLSCLRKR